MTETDPLAHIRVGDDDPTWFEPEPDEVGDPAGDDPCEGEHDGGPVCTRQRHPREWQHIAGAGPKHTRFGRRYGGVLVTWFADDADDLPPLVGRRELADAHGSWADRHAAASS